MEHFNFFLLLILCLYMIERSCSMTPKSLEYLIKKSQNDIKVSQEIKHQQDFLNYSSVDQVRI